MARRGARKQITLKNEPEEEKESSISYMQPEILPVQVMTDVLKEKGISATVLEEADKAAIVQLFHKYVTPKCQREYRSNRRGRQMKRLRDRQEKKVEDSSWKKMVVESTGKSTVPSSSVGPDNTPGGERLKPPPSCIDTSRKTIKLSGSTKAKSSGLDFVIKKRSSDEGKPEGKDKKLHISTNGQEKRKSTSPPQSEAKKLKSKDSEDESMEESNNHQKKAARKPIKWP